jgi:hypothetical protein
LPRCLFALLLFSLWTAPLAQCYSVLTHEAIIDAAWKDNVRPLLLQRFPDASPDELRKAHAYAYGGAIIQDIGYYPFGNKVLSDLLHYVRSGDFVMSLLAEAQDLNEYAFALGAMAHYAADSNGHRDAINRVVPILYPKLKTRFGSVVTYADDPVTHLKVEFSFDVAQVALGAYAPEAYHDFIGFEVARPLMERAFAKTYSLDLSTLLHEELAIATYRYTVSSILPTMTKAAWRLKEKEIRKAQPSITKSKFVYNVSRSGYRKNWGRSHERPGFGASMIAFVFTIVPKVGPLRSFAFRAPTPAGETMFMKSVNDALDQYRKLLAAQGQGVLNLPNTNFDTGGPVEPGHYRLADAAYARLLDKLNGKPLSDELRADILAFYRDLNAPFATKSDEKAWNKTLTELDALKASPAPVD